MSEQSAAPVVVVTGANGLVGARTCAALLAHGARVRAVVRREGAAPQDVKGIEEVVGDFADSSFAAQVVRGADTVVTTVHPMGSDRSAQEEVGLTGTTTFLRAAVEAGVGRHVHVSTAGVYVRDPGTGDVDEAGALVGDGAGTYPEVKRDVDAAIAEIGGITRVLVRPPAILGAAESSVWNTLRPAALRDDPEQRHGIADKTFAWVHVDDLADLVALVAGGAIADSEDPSRGPVPGGCTPVNLAGEPATEERYLRTVADALGVEITWDDEPAWTGQLLTGRARGWGWTPRVTLDSAMAELASGVRGGPEDREG
ncbi:hypothetical protein GCM10011519_08270 [Marmoricola endophyticus]|uniref:NAD-dependent epimerase/dehydratase domain-containing protein n=1 Tax=Marmoricola endophyticus TaxID=2040280 RepID=A0A917BE01_9ACTN|nr:NAD(P)-dependent oxidoreductase [Marmoricola endophyticus]GGF37115.1 hypothetical protein GCM10011519_08270 [Marmoricola endophyticus]